MLTPRDLAGLFNGQICNLRRGQTKHLSNLAINEKYTLYL